MANNFFKKTTFLLFIFTLEAAKPRSEELSEVLERAQKLATENPQLQKQVKKLTKKVEDLNLAISKLKQENSAIARELQNYQGAATAFQNILEQMKAVQMQQPESDADSLAEILEVIDRINQEIEVLKTIRPETASGAELASHKSDIAALSRQLSEEKFLSERNLTQLTDRLSECNSASEEIQKQMRKLEEEKGLAVHQAITLDQENTELRSQIQVFTEQAEQEKQNFAQNNFEISQTYEEALQKLNVQVEAQSQTIASLEDANASLEQKLRSAKELEEKQLGYEAFIGSVLPMIEDLQYQVLQQIQSIEEPDFNAMQTLATTWENFKAANQKALGQANQKARELEQENNRARARNNELERKIIQAQEQVSRLHQELENRQQEREALLVENQQLNTRLTEQDNQLLEERQNNKQLQESLNRLKQELESAQATLQQLETQNAEQSRAIKSQMLTIQQKDSSIESLRQTYRKSIEDIEYQHQATLADQTKINENEKQEITERLNQVIQQLGQDKNQLEAFLNNQKNEILKQQSKAQQLGQQNQILAEDNQRQEEIINTQQNFISSQENQIQALLTDNQAAQEQNRTLWTNTRALEAQIKDLKDQSQKIITKYDALNDAQQKEIFNVKEQLRETSAQLSKRQQQYENLFEKYRQIQENSESWLPTRQHSDVLYSTPPTNTQRPRKIQEIDTLQKQIAELKKKLDDRRSPITVNVTTGGNATSGPQAEKAEEDSNNFMGQSGMLSAKQGDYAEAPKIWNTERNA